jgi:UDP-N-acetylglucosamine--N-acetylmuramyl-(pentapeptide) pyrophosphoryl-undecaprenol N-acetylglucosamine transferase
MKLRVLLTGGGSGGHIYPLIAVVQKLQELKNLSNGTDLDIQYFGDPGEYRELLDKNQVGITHLPESKLRRYFDPRNVLDFFKFFIAFFQALWKVFWFMPDVAFSKGGPGALSVLYACRFYQIPIIIHDSDAVPGLTNRASGKGARVIELAFQNAQSFFPKKKTFHLVGNPIREHLLKSENTREASKAVFDFTPNLPVLLFLGGSQGAAPINNFLFENNLLLLDKFQIIHQVGKKNYEAYKNEYTFFSEKYNPELKKRYVFMPYLEDNLKEALNAADLIIARAGSSTIFEIAYTGTPSILVPLPEAANNHQWENAIQYEKTGACVVITQENLLGRLFIVQADKILKDGALYQKMSEAAKNFYIPNSAQLIAKDIISVAGKG